MCNTKSHKRFLKKNHQNLLEKKLAELFNLVGSFSINPKEEEKNMAKTSKILYCELF